jgi:hypothetical protein
VWLGFRYWAAAARRPCVDCATGSMASSPMAQSPRPGSRSYLRTMFCFAFFAWRVRVLHSIRFSPIELHDLMALHLSVRDIAKICEFL